MPMSDIYKFLDDFDISYQEYLHKAFMTCEDSEGFYLENNILGAKAKSLFVRNRKGNQHYLIVLESHKTLDLKDFRQLVNESNLSFASDERLMKYLQVLPGSVTPFALIKDSTDHVKVYIDQSVIDHDLVHFHPDRNTATLELSSADFRKFLNNCGNQWQAMEF